jgi:methylglyoxal reductase
LRGRQSIVIQDYLTDTFLIPICEENDVAVLARCVLDEGGLTGFLSMDTEIAADDFRANYFDQGPRDLYIEKVEALRKFLPEHAGGLAALALKFVTKHPGVTTALSSMNIREHAEANVAAMGEEPLSDDVFTEIRYDHRWIHNFYSRMSL